MIVYAVTKSPVDLPDTFEFIGVFTTKEKAEAACKGAGQFKIAKMTVDRAYRGDLYDVSLHVLLDHRQV